jgi:histone H3/H4
MAELPAVTFGRIIREKFDARMTTGSKEQLRNFVEDYASLVAKKAVAFASHAGRKTVRASDIELAVVA